MCSCHKHCRWDLLFQEWIQVCYFCSLSNFFVSYFVSCSTNNVWCSLHKWTFQLKSFIVLLMYSCGARRLCWCHCWHCSWLHSCRWLAFSSWCLRILQVEIFFHLTVRPLYSQELGLPETWLHPETVKKWNCASGSHPAKHTWMKPSVMLSATSNLTSTVQSECWSLKLIEVCTVCEEEDQCMQWMHQCSCCIVVKLKYPVNQKTPTFILQFLVFADWFLHLSHRYN